MNVDEARRLAARELYARRTPEQIALAAERLRQRIAAQRERENPQERDIRLQRQRTQRHMRNMEQLAGEVAREVPTLNAEQSELYQKVMESCAGVIDSKLFLIDGPGGTGKTYLENLILKSIRAQGNIALATASSGIAALLLSHERTAHSRFKIPIDIGPSSICSITKQSALANLIRDTSLILWDEAPMTHKFAIEALDRSLRDLTNNYQPFGGITVVMSGDFPSFASDT